MNARCRVQPSVPSVRGGERTVSNSSACSSFQYRGHTVSLRPRQLIVQFCVTLAGDNFVLSTQDTETAIEGARVSSLEEFDEAIKV